MKIVVDLGCVTWIGEDDSLAWLIEQEQPDVVFGFDPRIEEERVFVYQAALVIYSRKAAWTHSGMVSLENGGNATKVVDVAGDVEAFNLCEWLRALPESADLVVKMDVEGAEYQLLKALAHGGLLPRISLLHVEYHGTTQDADASRLLVRKHGGNIVDWWL